MPNIEKTLPSAVDMTTDAIGSELQMRAKRVEKEQWRIAELLCALRPRFDTDKDFEKFAAEKSGYTLAVTRQYLITYDTFKDNKAVGSNQKSENPIPFSKLAPLADPKIKAAPRLKIVKQLLGKNPPTEKQVRIAARLAKPDYIPPPITYNKPFAIRAEQIEGRFKLKPEYLLELQENSSVELVRLVAKHWKGKYHPDKGGDAAIFSAICDAEKQLLEQRGVK